jgi:hypothetical protein
MLQSPLIPEVEYIPQENNAIAGHYRFSEKTPKRGLLLRMLSGEQMHIGHEEGSHH